MKNNYRNNNNNNNNNNDNNNNFEEQLERILGLLENELTYMLILANENKQLFVGGLISWGESGDVKQEALSYQIQAKRWAEGRIPRFEVPANQLLSPKEIPVAVDYRPFVEPCIRYTNKQESLWKDKKKSLMKREFGSIAISSVHFYMSQATSKLLGVGVFIANFFGKYNIEIIFQVGESEENVLKCEEELYSSLKTANYRRVVETYSSMIATRSLDMWKTMNALVYFQISMIGAHALVLLGESNCAYEIYQQLLVEDSIINVFNTSIGFFTLQVLNARLEYQLLELLKTKSDSANEHVDEDDDNECIICFTLPSDVCLRPCGHNRFCKTCVEVLKKRAKGDFICPYCRTAVETID